MKPPEPPNAIQPEPDIPGTPRHTASPPPPRASHTVEIRRGGTRLCCAPNVELQNQFRDLPFEPLYLSPLNASSLSRSLALERLFLPTTKTPGYSGPREETRTSTPPPGGRAFASPPPPTPHPSRSSGPGLPGALPPARDVFPNSLFTRSHLLRSHLDRGLTRRFDLEDSGIPGLSSALYGAG